MKFEKIKDDLSKFIVKRLLSKRIIYHAGIEIVAYSTSGKYSSVEVPTRTVMDALGIWEKEK